MRTLTTKNSKVTKDSRGPETSVTTALRFLRNLQFFFVIFGGFVVKSDPKSPS